MAKRAATPEHQLLLTYDASLHDSDGELLGDVARLQRCDGADARKADRTALKKALRDRVGPYAIGIRAATATLRFDRVTAGLRLELAIVADRSLTAADHELLLAAANLVVQGSWGDYVAFRGSDELEESSVSFSGFARERLPSPSRDALRALAVSWADLDVSTERLAKVADAELDAIATRLDPHRHLVRVVRDDPSIEKAVQVSAAVYWESSRRKAAAVAEGFVKATGIEPVPVDDLDRLDDLPPDVF